MVQAANLFWIAFAIDGTNVGLTRDKLAIQCSRTQDAVGFRSQLNEGESPMRILIACYFNYPLHTGVATYMNQLRKGLVNRGHTVDIFAEHTDGTRYYITNSNQAEVKSVDKAPIERLAETRVQRGYSPYESVPPWIIEYETQKYAFELAAAELVDWSRYDVVHAQEIHSSRVMSRLKPKSVPLVVTLHGCVADETLPQLGYNSMPNNLDGKFIQIRERYGILSADIAVVPSSSLKNVFVDDFGIPEDHIRVVHHGIDTEAFLRSTRESSDVVFPHNKKIIFCHARHDPFKGHKDLIDALGKLKAKRQDWVCYLAGDGSLRHQLESEVVRLGLSQDVVFLGTRGDIPSLLKQADIMVQSSTKEAWGFTVTEALVAGKAVVCTNVGGFKEMVRDNQTGLLVPPTDPQALANSLERLLRNRMLRTRLGKNAQVWARTHLGIDRMARDTLHVYEEAFRVERGSLPSELFRSIIENNHSGGSEGTNSTSPQLVRERKLMRLKPAFAELYTRDPRGTYRNFGSSGTKGVTRHR